MKFIVTSRSNIVCDGCGATTLVMGGNVYDTDDLTCVCDNLKYPSLLDEPTLAELTDKVVDITPKPLHNSKVAKAEQRENKDQAKMFEDEVHHVIDPDDDMDEDEVRAYLKALKWQELLEAAKNNKVAKPPEMKRDELEELIIQKVFYEGVKDEQV